jgi:hypothetical protein
VDLDQIEALMAEATMSRAPCPECERYGAACDHEALACVAALLAELRAARRVVAAVAKIDPYRLGAAATACNICDAWTWEGRPVEDVEHEDDCPYVLAREIEDRR